MPKMAVKNSFIEAPIENAVTENSSAALLDPVAEIAQLDELLEAN